MKSFLKKIDNLIFRHLEDDYIRALKKECDGCETILDVGCGAISPIQYFSQTIKYSVGIDSFAPSIEKSKSAGIHNEYVLMDVMEVSSKFPENSFEYVVAFDLFEHLEKNEGYRLIAMMEKIARKKSSYSPRTVFRNRANLTAIPARSISPDGRWMRCVAWATV